MPTPYFWMLYFAPQMRVRALLNGIPFYRSGPIEFAATRVSPANHFLVPGENTFEMQILSSPDNVTASFEVNVNYDHDAPVYSYAWPAPTAALPVEPPARPFLHVGRFRIDDLGFRPAWLDAPKSEFGPDGTPELRQAVARFHEAVARADADAVTDQLTMKLDELHGFYGDVEESTRGGAHKAFAEQFAKGVQTRPLEMDKLVFEPCADGRVAYVTRADDGFAVEAVAGDGDRLLNDLWFTRRPDGGWAIFR